MECTGKINLICVIYPLSNALFRCYLHVSLFHIKQRSFEERKRGDFRKKWLLAVENSARTSGAMLEPVFKTIYLALYKDAEVHGRNKKIAAHVAFVEPNDPAKSNRAGANCLKYVSCTTEDVPYVLDKTLYRDMKCVSFTVVDSGKPIHVPRVLHNGGVHLWNSVRKEEVDLNALLSINRILFQKLYSARLMCF